MVVVPAEVVVAVVLVDLLLVVDKVSHRVVAVVVKLFQLPFKPDTKSNFVMCHQLVAPSQPLLKLAPTLCH